MFDLIKFFVQLAHVRGIVVRFTRGSECPLQRRFRQHESMFALRTLSLASEITPIRELQRLATFRTRNLQSGHDPRDAGQDLLERAINLNNQSSHKPLNRLACYESNERFAMRG